MREFGAKVPKIKQLRSIGVNSPQMVRAAGTPAILYGCHISGVSDTGLNAARSKVASAASPAAGGRNPTLALLAMDGSAGTLDPGFEAHVEPTKHWALAVWERWQPREQLVTAFANAATKLASAVGSPWSMVHGPTTAVITTLERLGWQMPSATEMITDMGHSLDLTLDPPIAIVNECKDSVRRWRLRLANRILPGLVPCTPDVGPAIPSANDRLVTTISGLSSLVKGKKCKASAGKIH